MDTTTSPDYRCSHLIITATTIVVNGTTKIFSPLPKRSGYTHDRSNVNQLEDTEQGGFTDAILLADAIGELSRPKKDMAENANAALALLRLSVLTEDAKYREAAERALRLFVGEYAQSSYFAAAYARAVEAARQPPLPLVVVGDPDDPRRWESQQTAWQVVAPGKAVEMLDANPAAERGYPTGGDGAPRAYVCIGQTCLAPVSSSEDLVERVREALARPA